MVRPHAFRHDFIKLVASPRISRRRLNDSFMPREVLDGSLRLVIGDAVSSSTGEMVC